MTAATTIDLLEEYRPVGVGPFIGVTRLPLVRVKASQDVPAALSFYDRYTVLGQLGDSRLYVLLNVDTGAIVPGMWPSHWFERADIG